MGASRLEVSQILDAAAQEFAVHGFEGMSMRVLADKLSATAAALYYHFKSKEELYDEVCRHIFDNIVEAVHIALQAARTPEQRLERFVSTLFDEWTDSTLLVLTQRDAINAIISPNRCHALSHHRLLFGLIRKIQSQYFQDDIDDTLSFAFCSMFFGYSSLLSYSLPDSGLSASEHRQKRKQELLSICSDLMKQRAITNSAAKLSTREAVTI